MNMSPSESPGFDPALLGPAIAAPTTSLAEPITNPRVPSQDALSTGLLFIDNLVSSFNLSDEHRHNLQGLYQV